MVISKQEFEKQKRERLGKENYNTFGTLMKIIEYNAYKDIWVEFQDEHKAKIHTEYQNFLRGNCKNPYDKTVCNIGYIGEGKYKSKINKKDTEPYKMWHHMIRRCYDTCQLNRRPTYTNCYVCKEWLNFQNFAKWYEENYYECNGEEMHLDKDILIKDNNVYSPSTCIVVPKRINCLFIKRQNDRGKYPIGVCYHNRDNVLEVWCCNKECKQQYLGRFNNEKDAFNCYKQFKEGVIKQVADEYKDLIPKELYEALYKYEVEIND